MQHVSNANSFLECQFHLPRVRFMCHVSDTNFYVMRIRIVRHVPNANFKLICRIFDVCSNVQSDTGKTQSIEIVQQLRVNSFVFFLSPD